MNHWEAPERIKVLDLLPGSLARKRRLAATVRDGDRMWNEVDSHGHSKSLAGDSGLARALTPSFISLEALTLGRF